MSKRTFDRPLYIFCYHKVATTLMVKVFSMISMQFGLRIRQVGGLCNDIPDDADIIVFQHSLIDINKVETPYAGVHFIRDPRDIIVSGYLYHKRCTEPWCTNTDFSLDTPVLFPKVPASQAHRPENWKRNYLLSLGNKSYQQNLRELTDSDGLLYEMKRYGAWTISSMLKWNYNNERVKEIRFETLMNNYDDTFMEIFSHLGFSGNDLAIALQLSARENLNSKTDLQVRNDSHISSRETTKWRNYFEEVHKKAFKKMFGAALIQFGYEDSNQW